MTTSLPEVRKSIVLKADTQKAWKAISTSEGIAAWWMPNTFEAIAYHHFVLHTGQFGDSQCKVTELEPLKRIGFDWGKDWHLVMELHELEKSQTEFTLIHSGWDAEKNTEFGQPHTVIRKIMDAGWDKIVKENLVNYIEK